MQLQDFLVVLWLSFIPVIKHQMKTLNSDSMWKSIENKIHTCLHLQEPVALKYTIIKM